MDYFTMNERPNKKASWKLVEQAERCKKIRLTTKKTSTKGGKDKYAKGNKLSCYQQLTSTICINLSKLK